MKFDDNPYNMSNNNNNSTNITETITTMVNQTTDTFIKKKLQFLNRHKKTIVIGGSLIFGCFFFWNEIALLYFEIIKELVKLGYIQQLSEGCLKLYQYGMDQNGLNILNFDESSEKEISNQMTKLFGRDYGTCDMEVKNIIQDCYHTTVIKFEPSGLARKVLQAFYEKCVYDINHIAQQVCLFKIQNTDQDPSICRQFLLQTYL